MTDLIYNKAVRFLNAQFNIYSFLSKIFSREILCKTYIFCRLKLFDVAKGLKLNWCMTTTIFTKYNLLKYMKFRASAIDIESFFSDFHMYWS